MQKSKIKGNRDHEMEQFVKNFREIQEEFMFVRDIILKKEGLTKPGVFLMHRIDSEGPMKLTNCSLSLGVSKPTITKIVDHLQKGGYVRRVRGGKDRRRYYLHITELGKEKLEGIHSTFEDIMSKAMSSLGPEEIRSFNSLLPIIKDRIHLILSEMIVRVS